MIRQRLQDKWTAKLIPHGFELIMAEPKRLNNVRIWWRHSSVLFRRCKKTVA